MPDSFTPAVLEDPFKGIDVPVRHFGEHITLPAQPAEMGLPTAIDTLQRKLREETQKVAINEKINAHYLDGAVAFYRAMATMFGWAEAVPTPGFWGHNPPQTLDVTIGANGKRMSVVWGRFEIPGIVGYVACDTWRSKTGLNFLIGGEVERRFHKTIVELAHLTRKFIAEQSIYKGKAFAMTADDDGDLDYDELNFLDTTKIDTTELVFSEVTERQIETSLWTPIKHTAACREQKIPLKRGVLLSGRYGTGKTLTAHATAKIAVEHGWTFLLLKRVKGLANAFGFRQGLPALRHLRGGHRPGLVRR